MIRLDRIRSLEVIDDNFTGAKRREKALELLVRQRDIKLNLFEKHAWKSGVWKAAKDQMFVETKNKCAYCETPTKVIDYGDVEHYRPKSKYWWLAYCYDNFLVSCAVCNQAYKSNHFPVSGPQWTGPDISGTMTEAELDAMADNLFPDALDMTAVDALIAAHAAEGADLVNPYYEDPADFFAYEAIKGLEEVRVVPTDHERSAQCVQAAQEIYGINRLELTQLRYQIFGAFAAFWEGANRADVPDDLRQLFTQEVAEMQEDKAPYAGMVRFFASNGGPVHVDDAIL